MKPYFKRVQGPVLKEGTSWIPGNLLLQLACATQSNWIHVILRVPDAYVVTNVLDLCSLRSSA